MTLEEYELDTQKYLQDTTLQIFLEQRGLRDKFIAERARQADDWSGTYPDTRPEEALISAFSWYKAARGNAWALASVDYEYFYRDTPQRVLATNANWFLEEDV